MTTIKKIQLLIILLGIILVSNAQSRSKRWDKENVKLVKKTDSTYINAVQSAQNHLPEFIDLLKEKNINNYNFNVRAAYTEEDHTEQLWFIVDSYIDNKFIVRLNNVPLHFKKLKLDDKLEILPENIKDWLISKNHKIIAGNFAKANLD